MSSGRPNAPYHWDLFWMLTRTEFRMRDQGTLMGFLWSLLLPLFQFLILYTLFTHWMAPWVEDYAAYLLVGIVQWNFFSSGTTHGLTSLRRKAGLIANFSFPRAYVALSSVFAVLVSHALEWGVLLVVLTALGVAPSWTWLLIPAVVAVELALVVGVACCLSFWAVDFRDLDYVWGILLYGLFFTTPIFYTPEVIGGAGRALLSWNPLAVVIQATRALVMGGASPPAASAIWVAAGAFALMGAALWAYPGASRDAAEKL